MTDKNAVVQLAPNQPQLLRLKFPSGKRCTSPYTGPQVMFSTLDGPALFVPPEGAASIEQAGIRPGERFTLCKRQEGKQTSWEVIRIDAKPGGPLEPPGTQMEDLAVSTTTGPEPINNRGTLSTQQSQAASSQLIAAIQAVKAAEEFATSIGRPVKFEAADVRAIAISCFIEQARRSA